LNANHFNVQINCITVGRIIQVEASFENRSERGGTLSPSQKGFIPNVNWCGEHRAMTERRPLYMLALDMRDVFGPVSHVQLRNNLTQIGLHKIITEVICNSYEGATVKIIALKGETNPIEIRRGVKQGCPLSPILFDLCIDPLIEKLSSEEFKGFGFRWAMMQL
jgi:hypothetical protein